MSQAKSKTVTGNSRPSPDFKVPYEKYATKEVPFIGKVVMSGLTIFFSAIFVTVIVVGLIFLATVVI